MSGHEFLWKAGDKEYTVQLQEANGSGTLQIGDRSIPFTIRDQGPAEGWIEVDGHSQRYYLHRNRNEYSVWIGGRTYRLERAEADRPGAQHAAAGAGSGEVRALMPGKILRIEVAEGAAVVERQTVLVMESMKMESSLHAPRAGKVMAVRCTVGQIVEMGEILMVIE